MLTFLGVDLGQKGAIAAYTVMPGLNTRSVQLFSFWGYHGGTRLRTATDEELYEGLKVLLSGSSEIYACVEHPIYMGKVTPMKTMSSLFNAFGFMRGLLTAYDVEELWLPKPRQWQKKITGVSSNKTKNLTMARRLYPKTKDLTKDNSDAVLICHACRLVYQ
jgi:hypothetical protein